MAKMILGVFGDSDQASEAVSDLEKLGYDPKDVSIVMKDKVVARQMSDATGATVVEGATSGATTGGLIGALTGLLVGIGAITIPGIGAVLIGGPLAALLGLSGAAATTVSGAATGALAGGLIGALTGLGVSDSDARHYEESIRSGGVLVAIPAESGDTDDALKVLDRHSAQIVRTITTGDKNPRSELSKDTDSRYHHR